MPGAATRGLDCDASTHQYAFMRTTIDLPDELYRSLKVRAALDGTTLREVITSLVEQGLRHPVRGASDVPRRGPPPVIVASRGIPIQPLEPARMRELEETEDAARLHSRSS